MTDPVETVRAALPRGNSLDDDAWSPRHRLLLWLLAAHIPGLVLLGRLTGESTANLVVEVGTVAVLVSIGALASRRGIQSTAVTLGLLVSTSIGVHLTGGLVAAYFHYFVVLAFVALYQDWRPYLLALAYVAVGHGVGGALLSSSFFSAGQTGASAWAWAAVLSAFFVAVCTAHVIVWKQTERTQLAAHDSFSRLYEGERAVVAQLRQAQTVKDQLFGIVGHEFRTPLTAIQGFARTLDARFDRMDRDAVQTCTQAIEREAKRLTRMVTNLLAASEEMVPRGADRALLRDVVTAVVEDVVETTPMAARHVRTHIPGSHVVRMAPDLAHQLLFNLVDNAVKFAVEESDVRVVSRRDGETVVVEVANVGPPIPAAERERIFDAFIQGDSSDTRRWGGIGLGLHIAAKIVDAHGGRIGAFAEGPLVIFRVWLPAAVDVGAPATPSANTLAG